MPRQEKAKGRRAKVQSPAYENVKNQMAYCGLWCGSCLVGNGTLNELARKCSKAASDYGVSEWGPKGVDYQGVLRGLDVIASVKPCPGCLKGGGRTNCEIRACARGKGVVECVDCAVQEACENRDLIRHMRSGASRVGMKVKDKKGSSMKTLQKWIAEIEDG